MHVLAQWNLSLISSFRLLEKRLHSKFKVRLIVWHERQSKRAQRKDLIDEVRVNVLRTIVKVQR